MKTILALAALLSVALAQNVIFDAAPYHHLGYAHGGHLGYAYGAPYGYLGNHLASGAVPGYAVWPGYFGHHGLVPVAAEAEEEEEAVEEASRKKRSAATVLHGLGHLGYAHRGYAAHPYAPFAYSHAYAAPYAAPYAFAPYAHYGARQILHGAPYYKVAAAEEEEEEAVEEASRKKRSALHGLGFRHHGLAPFGYAHHAVAAPVVVKTVAAPVVTHSYTAAVPVETEYKYKTVALEDTDEPTPADTTLVEAVETEHTAKAVHYEPKVFSYTAPAYPFYYGHHAVVAAPAKEERKKRSVVVAHHGIGHLGYAHHGLGHFGYAHHGYAAAVPVTTEYKYKTISIEDTDEPTPADTTLVEAVETEHTAKAVHYAPAYYSSLYHH